MQQVIYLESHDLLDMKNGKTVQIAVGGATVMLGYMGRTYKTSNGKHAIEGLPTPKPKRKGHRPWNKGKKMKKSPKRACTICSRKINAQGMAPHMGMHRRNGELKGVV